MKDEASFPSALRERFEPVEVLGHGGHGSVWLARQASLDRPVAVKVLNACLIDTEEQVARFQDEARLTASLRHPGLVQLLDHGVTDGIPWMAFELVEGESLRRWVQRGRTDWRTVLAMALEVAVALEEARRHGIVHRDIKPDNILYSRDGRYRLADFGIAKWAGGSIRTADGLLLGTPAYMSPTTIKGHLPDHRSDLYALGVTIYELLAGRPPFVDDNPLLVLERHLTAVPPSLNTLVPGLPAEVEGLVERLLCKERESRFDTAAEVATRIERILLDDAAHLRGATPVDGDGPRDSQTSLTSRTRPLEPRRQSSIAALPTSGGPAKTVTLGVFVAGLSLGGLLMALRAPSMREPERETSAQTPRPPASPSVGARAGDELDDMTQEAISLRRAARDHLRLFPGADDLSPLSPSIRNQLERLGPILSGYFGLLRRTLAYRGPSAQRLVVVELAFPWLLQSVDLTERMAARLPSDAMHRTAFATSRAFVILAEIRDLLRASRNDPTDRVRSALAEHVTPYVEAYLKPSHTLGLALDTTVSGQTRAAELLERELAESQAHAGLLRMALVELHARIALERLALERPLEISLDWSVTPSPAVLAGLHPVGRLVSELLRPPASKDETPFLEDALASGFLASCWLACRDTAQEADRPGRLRTAAEILGRYASRWREDCPWEVKVACARLRHERSIGDLAGGKVLLEFAAAVPEL